jgi:hypothetical protein
VVKYLVVKYLVVKYLVVKYLVVSTSLGGVFIPATMGASDLVISFPGSSTSFTVGETI